MKFGAYPLQKALGGTLTHAVEGAEILHKKGALVTAEICADLAKAGHKRLSIARADSGDMDEDRAADRIATALLGENTRRIPASNGRAHLMAEKTGLLDYDAGTLARINRVDEGIAIALLPPLTPVNAGDVIATIKIIPFFVSAKKVEKICSFFAGQDSRQDSGQDSKPDIGRDLGRGSAQGLCHLRAFAEKNIAVISTLLPSVKPSIVEKTLRILEARLAPSASRICADLRVAHEEKALMAAINAAVFGENIRQKPDMLIIFGASAISDRRDVLPIALKKAGGKIVHLGMPVDPGNLLMLGEIAHIPVIGAPGCARSPQENGFDFVLNRLLAKLPVSGREIMAMGAGGLLQRPVLKPKNSEPNAPRAKNRVQNHEEFAEKPQNIAQNQRQIPQNQMRIHMAILAAGKSSRMQGAHKLLLEYQGKPILRHVLDAAIEAVKTEATHAAPSLISLSLVVGHQREDIAALAADLPVAILNNAHFAAGLSTSLRVVADHLPEDTTHVLVLLGDMPLISAPLIARIVEVARENPHYDAYIPLYHGQRGNPVLLSAKLFPALRDLQGDQGAGQILRHWRGPVLEFNLENPAITLDVDTREAFVNLR